MRFIVVHTIIHTNVFSLVQLMCFKFNEEFRFVTNLALIVQEGLVSSKVLIDYFVFAVLKCDWQIQQPKCNTFVLPC